MLTLTKQELASLTPSEQQCAKILGLDTNSLKRTRKSHSKCIGGKPYILVTTVSCRLCNSLQRKVFHMQKQNNRPFFSGNALHSIEIPEIPIGEALGKMEVKKAHCTVRHCKNCYSYFMNFDKEVLIKKFLSYIHDGRNFIT